MATVALLSLILSTSTLAEGEKFFSLLLVLLPPLLVLVSRNPGTDCSPPDSSWVSELVQRTQQCLSTPLRWLLQEFVVPLSCSGSFGSSLVSSLALFISMESLTSFPQVFSSVSAPMSSSKTFPVLHGVFSLDQPSSLRSSSWSASTSVPSPPVG